MSMGAIAPIDFCWKKGLKGNLHPSIEIPTSLLGILHPSSEIHDDASVDLYFENTLYHLGYSSKSFGQMGCTYSTGHWKRCTISDDYEKGG